MEERIVDYKDKDEIDSIIKTLSKQDFLFVKHSSKTKQLYFKKYPTPPETLIISDP